MRFFHSLPANAVMAQTTAHIPKSRALLSVRVWSTWMLKQRRLLRVIVFLVGLFLLPMVLPASPVHHALVSAGYGGGAASSAMHVSQGITQPALTNPLVGLAGLASKSVSSAFQTIVGDIVNTFLQWVHDSLTSLINSLVDLPKTFNFITQTPHGLTDDQTVVHNLEKWMLLVMDGLLALFLVIGGYNVMFGTSEGVREFAPRLVAAAIVAQFSLSILGQFIEANNVVCGGIGAVLATLGIGHLGLDPVGLFHWVQAPQYLLVVYLIYLVAVVLLIVQMLLRIALLDLLLVLAPLGILCLALPQTRMWGQMWAQIFVATFITQLLQLLCVAIGAALIASFGHGSTSPVSVFVGIAALFLAGKIPDMLLFRVLRLNSSTAKEFGEQVSSAVQTGAEMAALVGA